MLTTLEAIPASPRVGTGVSGPRDLLRTPGTGIPLITPVAFPELECPDFEKTRARRALVTTLFSAPNQGAIAYTIPTMPNARRLGP